MAGKTNQTFERNKPRASVCSQTLDVCNHTNEIPRLRFGIGTDEKMRPAENYVLKPFNSKDQDMVYNAVTKAADALDSFLFNGLQKTMNTFNS